jgi:hypothetical protein
MDTAPPFRQTGPGVFELRQGGGCLALFGLPFFLAGVYLLLGAAGLVPLKDEFSRPWTGRAPAAASLLFLVPGGALVFGRRTVTFDLSTRCITRRFSIIAPLWTARRLPDEFNTIVIAFVPGDAESQDRYPVRLRAIAGKDFTVSSPTQFGESRRQAEFLSRELRFPLADETTEHEVVVAPEHAGETLQQRLRHAGTTAARPAAPLKMRFTVTESPAETTVVIPRRISRVAGAAGVVVGL